MGDLLRVFGAGVRLRGRRSFWREFVRAGVSAVCSSPEKVEEKAALSGFSLLTEDDAVCVAKHRAELIRLMKTAGVPCLEDVGAFQLQREDGDDMYPLWVLAKEAVSYIESDDVSILLAKL